MTVHRVQVAVVGPGECDASEAADAAEVGELLARAGAVVLTGGRGGVMAAASRGASEAGGLTVGLLPGASATESPPDPTVEIALYTGLGQARNLVLVLSAAAVIAVGGSWGTLSEIALARKHGRPVVLFRSWSLQRPDRNDEPDLVAAGSPAEAVDLALRLARRA